MASIHFIHPVHEVSRGKPVPNTKKNGKLDYTTDDNLRKSIANNNQG